MEMIRLKLTDAGKREIEQFQELMESVSIDVSFDETDQCLRLQYDPRELKRQRTRDAGREEIRIEERCGQMYRYSQIRKMMEEDSADHIAGLLGISRATLFRRLKRCRLLSSPGYDPYI